MRLSDFIIIIAEKYPLAFGYEVEICGELDTFEIQLENGWMVSLGCHRRHMCDTRVMPRGTNPAETRSVEVAIFRPNGDFYIAEGMDNLTYKPGMKPPISGVFSFKTLEDTIKIVEYIAEMAPDPDNAKDMRDHSKTRREVMQIAARH